MSVHRNRLLAKTAIAVKQLGIADDDFRDLLESRYKVRSRTKLSDNQLIDLIKYFESKGFKPLPGRASRSKRQGNMRGTPNEPVIAKMRALWISGWNLGVVRDPSDKALSAFAARVTGKDRIEWQHGGDAAKVIEGIKGLLAREAQVVWDSIRVTRLYEHGANDGVPERMPVVWAQLKKLEADPENAVRSAALGQIRSLRRNIKALHARDIDRLIETMGLEIRELLAISSLQGVQSDDA